MLVVLGLVLGLGLCLSTESQVPGLVLGTEPSHLASTPLFDLRAESLGLQGSG